MKIQLQDKLRHSTIYSVVIRMDKNHAKRETIKLSILFFILFTATNSVLTMITYIYEQAELAIIGPANIATSYLAFIFSTIYAPSCKWRIKTQMLVATIAYTLNYSTGLLIPHVSLPFKFTISITGAILSGLTAGLLWVSQGRYIHIICQRAGIQHEKGEHFGIFSLIYCLSHISAGLITTFGLGLFSPETYFLCVTIAGMASIFFCWIFIKDISSDEEIEKQNNIRNQVNQTNINEPNTTNLQSLTQVFRYYPQMSSILFILIIDGLCYGIHISQITHMIPTDTPENMMNLYAGFCNVSLGCGASLGGYISGWFGDKMGSKKSGILGLIFYLLGCAIATMTIYLQNFTLTLVSAFFWGFFLFYIEGWLYVVCSRQFKGRSQSFSVNKQLGSITCFLFQIIVLFTGNDLNLKILFPVIALLAIPALLSVLCLPSKNNLSTSQLIESDIEDGLIKVSK